MEKLKCTECGQLFDDNQKECPNCGNPASECENVQEKIQHIKCEECGHMFYDRFNILNSCPNCGAPIERIGLDKRIGLDGTSKKGRENYKIFGVVMLVISVLYALSYIFGHILHASGDMIKSPDISDMIMMQYALLFAIYGLIFIYLYKN